MNIVDALSYYGEHHAPTLKAPERIGYCIDALLPFWGNLKVAEATGETCRRYAAYRGVSGSTVRRELNCLQSALNLYSKEGYLQYAPTLTKPAEGERKNRWLTRDEVARLLSQCRHPKRRHMAIFILIGVYTGTRHKAILSLQFQPNTEGGWIDTTNGLIYRRGEGERESIKRRTTAKLPRKLLAHLKRLERRGSRYVVNIEGQRVGNIRKAFVGLREAAGLDAAVVPHTLKHTAITWGMQGQMHIPDAASFFGTSVETIQKHYWHHSPDFQQNAADAMDRKNNRH